MGEIRCTLSPKAERNKKHFKWSVEFIFLSHLPINKSCTIFFSVNSGYTQLLLSPHSICQLARRGRVVLGWEGRNQGVPEVGGAGAGTMVAALEVSSALRKREECLLVIDPPWTSLSGCPRRGA